MWLDADEQLETQFFTEIKKIINTEKFNKALFPRINAVKKYENELFTYENVLWHSLSKDTYAGFPDYQGRLYKKDKSTNWTGKVHETLAGANRILQLNYRPFYILHAKTQNRYDKAHKLYVSIGHPAYSEVKNDKF